jgi:hypothetical protein
VSESEDRYFAEINEECEGVLGRGIELLGLEREERDDGVRLVARYRLEDRVWEGAGIGESVRSSWSHSTITFPA